jgi:hypothetical protein
LPEIVKQEMDFVFDWKCDPGVFLTAKLLCRKDQKIGNEIVCRCEFAPSFDWGRAAALPYQIISLQGGC